MSGPERMRKRLPTWGGTMRKTRFAIRIAAVLLFCALVPFRATAGDARSAARVSTDRANCEKACHDDHKRWVDLCIANHDPREITPSARGQCVAAGAERLKRCLQGCR